LEIASLANDLKSADAPVRAKAAEELAHLVEGAQPAAVPLVLATSDADESVRQWATAALESLGPPRPSDVGKLAELLADSRLDVAYWAATLLGRLETGAGGGVPNLAKALQSHPESAVRERCAWALGQIGPAACSALASLNRAAADPHPRLSRLAKQAIEQISSRE